MRLIYPLGVYGVLVVSIHAPHVGCDSGWGSATVPSSSFQFTHPMRGATHGGKKEKICAKFQFTHPMRGATTAKGQELTNWMFQFTHPMRGATRSKRHVSFCIFVSIHAPHAGCDSAPLVYRLPKPAFQFTHPMRGATQQQLNDLSFERQFQFTHPMRGATSTSGAGVRLSTSFNSRTPCGVRLLKSNIIE